MPLAECLERRAAERSLLPARLLSVGSRPPTVRRSPVQSTGRQLGRAGSSSLKTDEATAFLPAVRALG